MRALFIDAFSQETKIIDLPTEPTAFQEKMQQLLDAEEVSFYQSYLYVAFVCKTKSYLLPGTPAFRYRPLPK